MKFFILTVVSLISFYALADQKNLSLKDAIELVKQNNKELKIESYKAIISATDLTLIKGEMRPKINIMAGVGPINGKTGNYQYYLDQNTWGAQWLATLDMKIPIYAWGRNKNLSHAANLNTEINQLDVSKMQNEIIYKLKESYYGWQYAQSLLDFLNETYNDLDGAIQALENKHAKKEDILRLEVFKYQLSEKKIEIEKNIRLAKIAINFYIGNDFSVDDKITIKNEREWIELDKRELRNFEYYLSLMNQEFPDLLKVTKGLEAKNELLLNEKKSALPVFGGMVKYDYAFTDQRTSQKNPFSYDPYNHNTLALGVGLTWNIDFGVNQSKQDKIFIEISELQSRQHFAEDGLKLLLNKSYMEVNEAETRALTLQKAYKSAKKWLANIGTSVSLGLTPAKDIIDAYTTRAIVYKDYYEAIYHYQLAWAKLSESTGVEVDPILTH